MMLIYFFAFIVLWSTLAFSDPSDLASSSSNPPVYEQINHAQFLVNDISDLYLDERFSDVIFVVENEEFHAHRAVLASRSEYFRVLLYGGHIESHQKNVPIEKATATSFKVFLEYIYTGQMNLTILEGNVILELLSLSNYYGFSNLTFTLSQYLLNNISADNASSLFTVAHYYELKELEAESLYFIDMHALDVLQSEDSLSLSPETLQLILNRDTTYANDIDVFRAACRWIKKNQEHIDADAKTNILSAVRYELMNDEEQSEVRRSELVCSDTIILDVIKSRIESLKGALNDRRKLEPNVNFARVSPKRITQIDGGTMIMLDRPSIINYIEMKLSGPYIVSPYSYYIEVSMDRQLWLRVIDHSTYDCRSYQHLWIQQRFVRYIRIVGTKNIGNNSFNFLKVMYSTDKMHLVEIKNGLVAPQFNVASILSATVTKGISITLDPDILVNGKYDNYDLNTGYTYHSVGSGCIQVQLSQPYVLSSMRMLLWDCDRRTYGYTVEVSLDNLVWDMVVDKSNKSARSWQSFQFDARPIVYIRITGIHTSKNDGIFRCVHLEAPAQISLDSKVTLKRQRSIFRRFGCK
ncbi:BTB/POZ domain-containing protein 9-like [Adelges cooleyi]|uniref:BTB/POZ domain-containing protein 9-like n=1 Tax=Adelges cooleyi TaxID=133065 RepID=UPI00217FE532|nr:BTB/POZ domain-containing protein 9-like [Adelges cooleyi]